MHPGGWRDTAGPRIAMKPASQMSDEKQRLALDLTL
jgi:hypothetical protein